MIGIGAIAAGFDELAACRAVAAPLRQHDHITAIDEPARQPVIDRHCDSMARPFRRAVVDHHQRSAAGRSNHAFGHRRIIGGAKHGRAEWNVAVCARQEP